MKTPTDSEMIAATRRWVEQVVVGFNLCPFAKRELVKDRVRFVVSHSVHEEALLAELEREIELMNADSSIETTLLIHPQVLQDFFRYNDFLQHADDLLLKLDLEGVYQIASFHPDYQFGGTRPADAENYTNRSPYPMLHLLREDSLSRAIDSYPDVDLIPDRNIDCMNQQGAEKMNALLKACISPSDDQ